MSSFDVKIWDIKKREDKDPERPKRRSSPYRLRWMVAGHEFGLSFRTKALADSERSKLVKAAKDGEAFDEETGRPVSERRTLAVPTWYAHVRAYMKMKWPRLAANSRRGTVEALTNVTVVLTRDLRGRPDEEILRRALYIYGLNPRRWEVEPPEAEAAALAWLARAAVRVDELAKPAMIRRALDACAVKLDGKPAAARTVARKRAVLYNAVGYAVECEFLSTNPIDKIDWDPPEVAEAIDRRVVPNPVQVAAILAKLREFGAPGLRLVAFFGCIYYTGGRPSEVAYLKADDCELPDERWGSVTYVETQPRAGGHWTDDGDPRETRGLKHRPRQATRRVPAPPELVALLREHIAREGVGPDGRLFRSARGNPLSDSVWDRWWKQAREAALSPAQVKSPLARRAYDLRHAAASLWLGSGVPPTRVAQRLGHSVAVLLRVYANFVDGDEELTNQRISLALAGDGTGPGLSVALAGTGEATGT